MKKHLLSLMILFAAANVQATTTTDEALVECTLTTGTSGDSSFTSFEELSLNLRQTQDADQNVFLDYVMKYTEGSLNSVESDIFGSHPQYTEVIFTSSNADSDGVVVTGEDSYRMTMNIDSSQINVDLIYRGQDQDDFATYEMVWSGYGPAYDITDAKITDKLAASEEYGNNNNPLLCVAHYDLHSFVTQ